MPSSQKPIRILIIDDDEDDYFITSEYLNAIQGTNFIIDWCYTYRDAVLHIKNAQHDVYLVDYRLGIKTGIDLIREAVEMQCDEPIILLTGKGDFKIDMEAMKLGAFDYLVKTELSSEKLERSIRYAIDRASNLGALRASEKKYRNIFDNSKDPVFVTDEHFYFTKVNNGFCLMMDCLEEDFYNQYLPDLLASKEMNNLLTETLREKGITEDLEVEIKNKNGETRQCLLSATKEKDIDGHFYYQGIFHDITFIRKAEKMTLQAEKLAAAGRLVRTLAHEVRNPINNINLAAEQLKTAQNDEEDKALMLDIIERNSNRINDLIRELLSSSRPAEIQMQACSLISVIDEVVAASIDRMRLKKISLDIKLPKESIVLECDRSKLVLALLNIVINAVEAMEEEKGLLKISALQANQKMLLKISDNGSGISPENLPRLFEPYFTSKRNGIGLGLASTLNIIQSHQGSIEASSILNEGTIFTIIMPLVKS